MGGGRDGLACDGGGGAFLMNKWFRGRCIGGFEWRSCKRAFGSGVVHLSLTRGNDRCSRDFEKRLG